MSWLKLHLDQFKLRRRCWRIPEDSLEFFNGILSTTRQNDFNVFQNRPREWIDSLGLTFQGLWTWFRLSNPNASDSDWNHLIIIQLTEILTNFVIIIEWIDHQMNLLVDIQRFRWILARFNCQSWRIHRSNLKSCFNPTQLYQKRLDFIRPGIKWGISYCLMMQGLSRGLSGIQSASVDRQGFSRGFFGDPQLIGRWSAAILWDPTQGFFRDPSRSWTILSTLFG